MMASGSLFERSFEVIDCDGQYESDDVRDRTAGALEGIQDPGETRAILSGDRKIIFYSERETMFVYALSTDFYEESEVSELDTFESLER